MRRLIVLILLLSLMFGFPLYTFAENKGDLDSRINRLEFEASKHDDAYWELRNDFTTVCLFGLSDFAIPQAEQDSKTDDLESEITRLGGKIYDLETENSKLRVELNDLRQKYDKKPVMNTPNTGIYSI